MAGTCKNCGREFATLEDVRGSDIWELTGFCMTEFAPRDPDAEKDCQTITKLNKIRTSWKNSDRNAFNGYSIQADVDFLLDFIKNYVGI